MIFTKKTLSLLLLLILGISACQSRQNTTKKPKDEPIPASQDSRLTLNNATLEQSNADGQLVWKIKVKKANYSKDQRVGKLEDVKGNLYQNGKVVLYISADKGEVYKEGESVFLRENITATDPRNGTIIKSEEVEWKPKEGLLMVRKNLRGSQENLSATALEGKYHTKKQEMELIGKVEATMREPSLQLKGERFYWEVPGKKIKSDLPINIVKFKDKIVTDQAQANRAEVDLKLHQLTAKENIEYRSLEPPISISTNHLVWDYQDRIVHSDVPSRLFHREDLITITSNKTKVDLNSKIAYLDNGVQGINEKTQAKLYSNQLTWNMITRIVEAQGNVIYEQVKPTKFNFTGDKAVGSLKENKLVVTGNNQDRVVTEIFPDGKKQ